MPNRLRSAVSLLLLVAVVVAPASAGWFDWLPFAAAPCGGFTLVGATPLQVTSNDENLSDKYTQLTIVANCGGESVGLIQRDQLSSFLNLPIGTDIEIGIRETTETNTYPIFNEAVPVYTYVSATDIGTHSAASWAKSLDPDAVGYGWKTGCTSFQYLARIPIGQIGSIGAPSSNAAAILTVKANSTTSTTRIGTLQLGATLTTADGDEIGSATWLGSLVTGQALPSESNYAAFYDKKKQSWKVITSAEKLAYITKQAATEAALMSVPIGTTWVGGNVGYSSDCWGTIYAPGGAIGSSSLSSAAASALQSSTAQLGTAPIGDASQLDGATIPFAVVGKIGNPYISLRIRADLLNIVLPVGKPSITTLSLPKFGVGELGKLTARVHNIGTAQGSFELIASCPGLTVQPSQAITILPGAVGGELSAMLIGLKVQTGTCEAKVCDINSRECVTKSIAFEVTRTKICIPGEIRPELSSIDVTDVGVVIMGPQISGAAELTLQRCNPDGLGFTTLLACESGTLVYQPDAKPYGWACTEVAKCGTPTTIISKYLAEELKSGCTPTYSTVTGVTEKYIGITEVSVAGKGFITGTWTSTEPVKVESTSCYDVVAKPESWAFLDSTSGCTYSCQQVFGDGTNNPPTGSTTQLLTCGEPTKQVEQIKSALSPKVGLAQPLLPPLPSPTLPPIKNETGAGTAGMCKVDGDCLYVGEGCVSGACQKKEGLAALPGFEAVFTVAGLLSVGYLLTRRRG